MSYSSRLILPAKDGAPRKFVLAEYLLRFVRPRPIKRIIVRRIVPVMDWLLAPLVFCSALLMKTIRRVGIHRMSVSRAILHRVGVFPIRDHYYEPLFNQERLPHPLDHDRRLPGIDLNLEQQLAYIAKFHWGDELARIPRTATPTGKRHYSYRNDNFGPGDAEYYYSLIRLAKPKRLIEVGSGFSTLMARHAIDANRLEDSAYQCHHLCIEPYEMDWLEKLEDIEIKRSIVENVDRGLFQELDANDILFIDSSHVIRPQGDVVRLHLEILPTLKPGVLVHIHDIFTPRDYPESWISNEVRMWNEQYLVEAFLTGNHDFKIIGALNFLTHHHMDKISKAFPVLAEVQEHCEVCSLWLVRC